MCVAATAHGTGSWLVVAIETAAVVLGAAALMRGDRVGGWAGRRTAAASRHMPTITIGFDGTAGSEAALRFGLHDARLRRADVRLVHAWLPTPYTTGSWGIAPFSHSVEGDLAAKRDAALAEMRAHVAHARVVPAAGTFASTSWASRARPRTPWSSSPGRLAGAWVSDIQLPGHRA